MVDDGAAFLEKIVQVSFKVPRSEAFDLQRWLLEECVGFYGRSSQKDPDFDQKKRLHSVCQFEGSLLHTPRDVVRILNAIKLCWYVIRDKVDYPDLVWLQIVRIKNEPLYIWIERYLVEYGAFMDGAAISESERRDLAAELKKHLVDGGGADPRSMLRFQTFVPGVRPGKDDKETLFLKEDARKIASNENNRRLASPQHSRHFFAFSKASGALEDSELYSFVSSAEGGTKLDDVCVALINERRPQGGTKFDILIDRLGRLEEGSVPEAARPPMMMALGNCMDLACEQGLWGEDGPGTPLSGCSRS